ncbi:hypothetical protein LZ31DRAFT_328224 [Colletotrichum somersetense]|nr:hypothetical protein LZ31DRAFT_328224 [Colletotrichum somersetense]
MRQIANPIIQDFWAFYGLSTWGVLIPVPIDVRELTQQLSTGKPFGKANAESMRGCCLHLYSSRMRLGLVFVPAKGRQATRVILTFPEPQIRVMDHTTLQFAKCFYTGMLYWAGSVYKTGEVTPLKDFLDIQYVK